jgi:AAA domain (dynein-related subfamily)
MSLSNSNLFQDVKKEALKFQTYLEEKNYDAIMVKKLAATNTTSSNATSNQYHIAITGDGIGFFPMLFNNLYFKKNYSGAKRMFLTKIPILLDIDNLEYMQNIAKQGSYNVKYISTHTTSIISVRQSSDTIQMELGDKDNDGTQWSKFREYFGENDYLVFLKKPGKLEYLVLGIKASANLREGVESTDYAVRNKSTSRTLIDIETTFVEKQAEIIQRILYGTPGTGKSYSLQAITQNSPVFRTTFHPELDFHGFVGGYRPAMKGEGEDEKITYQFVPQVFMQAYTAAWNNPSEMHYLVIEEINRGSCAAIFGSLFQLLDRDEEGFSEYSIQADAEQAKYLEEVLDYDYEPLISALYEAKTGVELENPYSILMLPNNLSIIATMNTSDQSLYPMDSAFKRRWDWEYCPIDYAKADEIRISIGDTEYNWGAFLRSVNQKIYTLTHSEDKQLGTFFAKAKSGIISQAVFCNKVLFFLWNDILKDENPNDANNFFKDANGKPFTFTQLHQTDTVAKIHSIFAQLNVPIL